MMKNIFLLLISSILCIYSGKIYAQRNVYATSGGELIFSWGDLQYTDSYLNNNENAEILGNPVRFTAFFHIGEYTHMDFNNTFGMYTGIGLRNIGMISNEVLPSSTGDGTTFDAKIIRRAYTLGIPVALKVGSFKDNFHVYFGGEYEWAFHYKEKYWPAHSRDGDKSKNTNWWPEQVTTFLPSAFVGIQFPKGFNLKFKYYLKDFLNHDYSRNPTSDKAVVSDLTKYKSSPLFYISLTFHVKSKNKVKKSKVEEEEGEVVSL
jgi:hypothetical protein